MTYLSLTYQVNFEKKAKNEGLSVMSTSSLRRLSGRLLAWMGGYARVRKSFVGFLILSTVALLSVDLMLIRELRSVTARTSRSVALRVGAVVPPLAGVANDGKPITVDYRGEKRKTLVLVFSPTCPICTQNWPRWERLASIIDSGQYRLVYVNGSMSSSLTPDYLRAHHVENGLVIAKVDPQTAVDYELNLTPVVELIDRGGKVLNVWLGMPRGRALKEMEDVLGLRKVG